MNPRIFPTIPGPDADRVGPVAIAFATRVFATRVFATRVFATLVFLGGLIGLAGCSKDTSTSPPQRIVLISIDTCRADHMSVYGYERPTTPRLETLARRSVVFDNAFCQVPDTTPSHASMLTSNYPFVHGAANGVPLDAGFTTLAEVLSANGFSTAAFVSGFTMTADASGLDQGFDVYDDDMTRRGSEIAKENNERLAAETADRALAWLDDNSDEPFFLFVHFFDPHGRYAPPPPYDTMFPPDRSRGQELAPADIPPYTRKGRETNTEVFIAAYDGEIRYVDDQIARILDELADGGIGDDTIVVITADHGESLTEHGMFFAHGWRLFEPSIHIPLIISAPGHIPQGTRIASIAQTIDIAPTVLELLDIDTPDTIDGISLVDLAHGRSGATVARNSFAIAKTTKSLSYLRVNLKREVHDHFAVRTADWKYLHSEDGRTRYLFDLVNDPGETRDRATQEPERVVELGSVLDHVLSEREIDAGKYLKPVDDEERARMLQRLEELGYIR